MGKTPSVKPTVDTILHTAYTMTQPEYHLAERKQSFDRLLTVLTALLYMDAYAGQTELVLLRTDQMSTVVSEYRRFLQTEYNQPSYVLIRPHNTLVCETPTPQPSLDLLQEIVRILKKQGNSAWQDVAAYLPPGRNTLLFTLEQMHHPLLPFLHMHQQ